MKWIFRGIFLLGILGLAGIWFTRPQVLSNGELAEFQGNPENGALIFAAMGCASCHMAPGTDNPAILAGGASFATQFGTFFAPNISPHMTRGIGAWTDLEIATAIIKGTSPRGEHYYPVFPYAAYSHASLKDIADLIAHLRSIEPIDTANKAHDIRFPFNIRQTLGGWKLLFMTSDFVVGGELSAELERGRYLVEALGHCGECHTPRNIFGGLERSNWLAGAANPSGTGRVPDIRPETLNWSQADIAEYLLSGFTPDFDSAGGEMVDVINNTSQLTDSDRNAIAAYLLQLASASN